ncbi:hsp90 co-chaperone Cdc37-like [Elysia marginata]|uniref:Hsp90 chaperone protein kinase-targeting subunit n=1 Tax=Elysia marginata TaxID=1093978 RepID=A0AAV4JQN8_9GAST|nr:hsp90 co-chaperone Cdc37-like [Elysia marginata]
MSTINYSKWDHIEISDDEDDTHPNIDTPSLFRWRHQARVERMEEQKKKKETFVNEKQSYQQKVAEMKKKLKEAEEKSASEEFAKLKIQLSELEKQEEDFKRKEEELKREERLTPLNIDTICKEGKSKTLINKSAPPPKELTEDEKIEKQQAFTKKYKSEIRKFGMLQKWDDSKSYLTEHNYLVCEETANYLVIWCIDLEVEEKHDLMKHVSHQCIVMQFILELAKSLKTDPRSCVGAFFSRIKLGEKQYSSAFNEELDAFRSRIQARAKARIEEAMKEYEEEERQKRLGPGGLDPVEVMESLPESLQKCFESQDIALLQQTVSEMPQEEAAYHIQRCIDSGLWVPGGAEDKSAEDKSAEGKQGEEAEAASAAPEEKAEKQEDKADGTAV